MGESQAAQRFFCLVAAPGRSGKPYTPERRGLGQAFGASPYQALLETFNPGLREEAVNAVFAELRKIVPTLVKKVTEKQATEQPPIPLPPVPVDAQRRLARRLTKLLGLEENHIQLGESAHPFSCGQWDDVRITVRYSEKNMMPALVAIIHETGHALYSSSLPRKWKDQPIGEPQSLWVHESQSLFWQYQVACGEDFMAFLSPVLKDELGVDGLAWSPQNLYRLVTRVKPGLIRIEADEVTYPAHVVLRHDLEQRIIDGTLAPRDLPEVWGKGMLELLKVEVSDNGWAEQSRPASIGTTSISASRFREAALLRPLRGERSVMYVSVEHPPN
jgi:carboxypeptidase Taq